MPSRETFNMTTVEGCHDYINALKERHESEKIDLAELSASLMSLASVNSDERELVSIPPEKYIKLYTSISGLEDQLHTANENVRKLDVVNLQLVANATDQSLKMASKYGSIVRDLKYKIRMLERSLAEGENGSEAPSLEEQVRKYIIRSGFSVDLQWDWDLLIDMLEQYGPKDFLVQLSKIGTELSKEVHVPSPEKSEDPDVTFVNERLSMSMEGSCPPISDDMCRDTTAEDLEPVRIDPLRYSDKATKVVSNTFIEWGLLEVPRKLIEVPIDVWTEAERYATEELFGCNKEGKWRFILLVDAALRSACITPDNKESWVAAAYAVSPVRGKSRRSLRLRLEKEWENREKDTNAGIFLASEETAIDPLNDLANQEVAEKVERDEAAMLEGNMVVPTGGEKSEDAKEADPPHLSQDKPAPLTEEEASMMSDACSMVFGEVEEIDEDEDMCPVVEAPVCQMNMSCQKEFSAFRGSPKEVINEVLRKWGVSKEIPTRFLQRIEQCAKRRLVGGKFLGWEKLVMDVDVTLRVHNISPINRRDWVDAAYELNRTKCEHDRKKRHQLVIEWNRRRDDTLAGTFETTEYIIPPLTPVQRKLIAAAEEEESMTSDAYPMASSEAEETKDDENEGNVNACVGKVIHDKIRQCILRESSDPESLDFDYVLLAEALSLGGDNALVALICKIIADRDESPTNDKDISGEHLTKDGVCPDGVTIAQDINGIVHNILVGDENRILLREYKCIIRQSRFADKRFVVECPQLEIYSSGSSYDNAARMIAQEAMHLLENHHEVGVFGDSDDRVVTDGKSLCWICMNFAASDKLLKRARRVRKAADGKAVEAEHEKRPLSGDGPSVDSEAFDGRNSDE